MENQFEFVLNDKMKKLIKLAKLNNSSAVVYPQLVDNLVRQNYSQRDVEAIINNYLDDNTKASHIEDFTKLQNYRKACKQYAKELLGIE